MFKRMSLSKVRTYPLEKRDNLVKLEDFISPRASPPPFEDPELREVAERIVAARSAGRPVIWMMGAHVIKCGLSLLLIDLMKRGVITHLATNGAGSIHDFEIALIGETSEDVASSIEDGTFGMAEETGALMNEGIQRGARDGLGYGEALGRMIAEDDRFRFKEYSLLHAGYKLRIPVTVHVAIGTDIIHQHPTCNFGALGWASGEDFKIFTASISELEGGVFLNVGSAVIGPEVFLKALSIVRNLGYKVEAITTANFDLIPLGDYRSPLGKDNPHYYYRPRKNIVNRPASLGGKGFHITGDHTVTIPNLHHLVLKGLPKEFPKPLEAPIGEFPKIEQSIKEIATHHPNIAKILNSLIKEHPGLRDASLDITRAYRSISSCFEHGGTLFLCGNGGSFADALHISGELLKSFERKRPIPERMKRRFVGYPSGEVIAESLEEGLRSVVLGANLSLSSAVQNDNPTRNMNYAQELYVLARPGDVLLGISTSGEAENVFFAAITAKAIGLTVIALTGEKGGRIAQLADVAIKAPANVISQVQEFHTCLFHCLCAMLEAHFFP